MNKETPSLAVDCIVMVPGGVVFIERKYPPLGFAIPGGFVDVGETLEQAAIREMKEELNVDVEILGRLGIYDNPKRDPRRHVVSVVFVGKSDKTPVAGDDAKDTKLVRIPAYSDVKSLGINLVFDHEEIIRDFVRSDFLMRHANCQETLDERLARKRKEEEEWRRKVANNEICSERIGCTCVYCTGWAPSY